MRKLSDPNYGKTSKFKPGIIITPMILALKDSIKIENSDVAPDTLRSALLFYEKIVFPESKTLKFSGGQDVITLEEQGIIQRMHFGKNGGPVYADDIIAEYPIACRDAFNLLESREPGCWAITTGIGGLTLWDGKQAHRHLEGMSARLYRAVPLPSSEMPIAEVLEFKVRRRDELCSLQDHIFNLSKEISDAENPETRLAGLIKEIDQDCSDLIKVSKEFPYAFNLSTIDVSFDLNAIGKMGFGFLAGYSAGLDLATSAMASVAANVGSLVNFSLGLGLRNQRWRSSPFSYVVQAHKELKI